LLVKRVFFFLNAEDSLYQLYQFIAGICFREDQLDRPCEKWSITWSQGGQ